MHKTRKPSPFTQVPFRITGSLPITLTGEQNTSTERSDAKRIALRLPANLITLEPILRLHMNNAHPHNGEYILSQRASLAALLHPRSGISHRYKKGCRTWQRASPSRSLLRMGSGCNQCLRSLGAKCKDGHPRASPSLPLFRGLPLLRVGGIHGCN